MRKRINPAPSRPSEIGPNWLSLEEIATVEVTSEVSSQPVENALVQGATTGWRAALPGEQTISLLFDSPQHLRLIHLRFVEREVERSQEFVLRYSLDGGKTFQEIGRQQWNFSPQGSTEESENYHVELRGVTQLELNIVPDRSAGSAVASLAELRLA